MNVRLFRFIESCSIPLRPLCSLRLRVLGLILVVISALSSLAHPQSNPEFQNRAWDLSVWAAASSGEEHTNSLSEAQVLSAGIFVGHALSREIGRGWRRGSFEFGADFIPILLQFTPQRTSGIAFDPILLRWNSSLHRGHVSPFLELGGGGVHTGVNFPSGNTSTFNFIARGGGGILVTTKHNQALEIACRWLHISSANLGTQNPEFNGIQVSLGWHWFK